MMSDLPQEELSLPVFVLFATGDFWAYPEVAQLDLDLRSLSTDELRAWDAEGRQLRFVGGEGSRLLVADSDQEDRAALQTLLMERLRERNVSGVEAMSFEELADKAAIRFVVIRPISAWKRFFNSFSLPPE